MLIENGAAAKGVARRLGHHSTEITQDLYTHETEKRKRDTLEVFERAMQTNSKCRQNANKRSK